MDALDALPPLRTVVEAGGLQANKALGQHFLFDLNITDRIVRQSGLELGDFAVEIGPGPGGLTRSILKAGAAQLLAIEKDTRFLGALDAINTASGGRLIVEQTDALRCDMGALVSRSAPSAPVRVIANLPYNVGTELLIGWLTGPRWWASLTLMFQLEVVERIVAKAGDAHYGRLAVLAHHTGVAHKVMDLPARAFTPPPKVDSAVVHITPKPLEGIALTALKRVTAAAFGQRRKMVRASLKSLAAQSGLDLTQWLESAGIDPTARPETLAPDAFLTLAQAL